MIALTDMVTVELMVREILKERERCAKIVESGICDGLSYEDKALRAAANEIRKDPPLPDRPKRIPIQPLKNIPE